MKITPVKGRPMLHWIGKHPIDHVDYYPAQLVESCNVEKPAPEPTYQDFKSGPNLLFQGDNREILSTLLVQGFRGKIDLIYEGLVHSSSFVGASFARDCPFAKIN